MKPNLEVYYNSPTKKVGQTYEIESAGWTNNNRGVLHKIDQSSAQLNENRKVSLMMRNERLIIFSNNYLKQGPKLSNRSLKAQIKRNNNKLKTRTLEKKLCWCAHTRPI